MQKTFVETVNQRAHNKQWPKEKEQNNVGKTKYCATRMVKTNYIE